MTDKPTPILEVVHHTQIVEFVLKNRHALTDHCCPPTAIEVLKRCLLLSEPNGSMTELLTHALQALLALEDAFLAVNVDSPDWQRAVPIVSRVASAPDLLALKVILREELGKGYPLSLQMGMHTGLEILEAGAETIYNPENWVVPMIWDPRQITGAGKALASKLKDKVVDVAKDDLVGAVAGAVAGAAKGAIFGGGVAVSIGAGAVTGAVAKSVTSAID